MHDQIIIIPAYKPEEIMVALVDELRKHFYQIIIIDDGSGQNYKSIFDKLEETCVVLYHQVNMGKGYALKTGFKYCVNNSNLLNGYGVITVDADGQHKVKDIITIGETMEEHPESIVFGCRKFKNDNIPWRSRVGNNISRVTYKWLCGINLADTQTGLRGIPFSFLSKASAISGERYEYETNFLIEASNEGIEFIEKNIETVYENNNATSHFNPIKDSIKIYSVIIKYSLSSLLSVLIDYLVFGFLSLAGVDVMLAVYMARVSAAIVNFTINRNVVFGNRKDLWKQVGRYALLLFVSGTISGTVIQFLISKTGISKIAAKVMVECILYFVNYYVQRSYVFMNKK